ncbi:hypothetical protein [Polaribacter porphyrae]|uniref:Uncharacterized protein n=1 Tax=Polaribacter porphyrae TaxID=1137780 RepID=A0A2S7WK65_9FLAO|nr:hypothetical protein [Polaribacter porphyrae]PQJ77682.1 hypothetical protein BTO18_00120 [Polaribacter porphyrae]
MTDTNKLLKIGLIAMSKSMENGFWLHGHVGAEILTNTFFIQDLEIDEKTKNAILNRITHIINSKRAYISDELLAQKSKNADISAIEFELENNINKLSTAGHGVIFGTLILKALQKLNNCLPKEVADGLTKLLQNTQQDYAERYYGFYDYQNREIDISNLPNFETLDEVAKYCMNHQEYYESQEIDGKFYHFHGKQIHLITHSNALVILNEIGYSNLAYKGLPELSKQIILGSITPPNAKPYQTKNIFNPLNASFWERNVTDEHHNKLAYAVIYLLKRYPDLDQETILQQVSGHWELMR